MKLKTKSTSFWKEMMKNQRWMILVSSLLMLVFFPIELMMNTQTYEKDLTLVEIIERISRYFMYYDSYSDINRFSSTGYVVLYVSLILGGIAGIMAFSYLHNSSQVGLFHSLPISRGRLANIKFQTSTIGYLISVLLGNIILVIMLITRGWLSEIFTVRLLIFLMYNLLFYWMGYLVSAIAMLLTGKVFIGVFGAITLSTYIPTVVLLVAALIEASFDTFYYNYNTILTGIEWGARISPISYIRVVQPNSFKYAIFTLLIICILWIIHKWLIKMRPSEAAGRTMAYRNIGEVIKVALVTVFAIGVSYLFYATSYYSNTWLYFGLCFGIVVGYIIIQLLYGIEFRELLKIKIQFFIITILSFGIITFFVYDLIGYDMYLPDYEDIKDINIEFNEVSLYSSNLREESIYEPVMGKDEETYALVQTIIASADDVSKDNYVNWQERTTIYVGYQLNSGRLVQREYTVKLEDVQDQLGYLWNNEEFLDMMYPVRWMDIDAIENVCINMSYTTDLQGQVTLGEEEKQGFLEAYKKDCMGITEETIEKENPIINASYYYSMEEKNALYGFDFFVYPSFTNTIQCLENLGYEITTSLASEDITQIEGIVNDEEVVITDQEEIEALLPELVSYQMIDNFMKVDYDHYYYIEMDGISNTYYMLENEE